MAAARCTVGQSPAADSIRLVTTTSIPAAPAVRARARVPRRPPSAAGFRTSRRTETAAGSAQPPAKAMDSSRARGNPAAAWSSQRSTGFGSRRGSSRASTGKAFRAATACRASAKVQAPLASSRNCPSGGRCGARSANRFRSASSPPSPSFTLNTR